MRPRFVVVFDTSVLIPLILPADPDDDKVIAAAIEAGASYIVSEDHHLLDLGHWRGIQIMSRDDFTAELDRLGLR